MKTIKLGGGLGLEAIVDDANYDLVSGFRWHPCNFDSPNRGHYCYAWIVGRPNRFILGLKAGDPSVDHINGNGLDCRRANLRLATISQNGANRNSKRAYKGVYLTPNGRWTATIKYQNRTHHLGTFDSAGRAALAYDRAAKERFGEFARLNFP